MKNKKNITFIALLLLFLLTSCNVPNDQTISKLDVNIFISTEDREYYNGDNIIIDVDVNKPELFNNVELKIVSENQNAEFVKNVFCPTSHGSFIIVATLKEYDYVVSNELIINVNPSIYLKDPYQNITKDEFYKNYEEAINLNDVLFRTEHGLMSGDLTLPNEKPTIATNQPVEDGKLVRNTNAYFGDSDKNTYYITDSYGEIVDMVFRKGGYISLDEVAAHLIAFCDVPGNYNSKKSARPSESIWNEYLRVNNTSFSGSTSKYPYEPELPNISGCGGDLKYYEIDFGTTGTTCDPSYDIVPYNNGTKITRGAARLVYTRYDKNGDSIIDINEMYVFYTYNHYNDFQEYLNYQGGWGEMFGNITGGGTLSSKTDYNPTKYVETVRKDFSIETIITDEYFIIINYKKEGE